MNIYEKCEIEKERKKKGRQRERGIWKTFKGERQGEMGGRI